MIRQAGILTAGSSGEIVDCSGTALLTVGRRLAAEGGIPLGPRPALWKWLGRHGTRTKVVEMRSKQAEAKFIELLQTGEVNEKIPLAAWAVGKMRSVEATPALIQALRQTAPEVSRIEQTIGQEESRTSSKTRQSSRTWCCAWLGKIRAVATRESKVPSPIWAMRCLVEL